MAERKAVNKYYPPDWDPRKQGSVNKRVGQHPLRDRARKLSQGILVIRFELPYNIWCGGCGSHVGMGVRYNAEKSKVGNYYSTPIYKFRMKCHLCDNHFEIQTDPQNHDYVILSGARRKEQRWDPHANEQIVPEDKATQKKLATDPMYKLEHGSDDKQKGSDKVKSLVELEESRISMLDDYLLNRMARDKFRAEKKELKAVADADKALLEKASLDIDLVDETEEDRKVAGLLKYSVTTSFEDKQKERRKSIEQRPLFTSSKPQSAILPHQRHTQPELSRRGQLKQKLGWALKASYKDPFKSEKIDLVKKSTVKTSVSPRAQLGIKLKSPPTFSQTASLKKDSSKKEVESTAKQSKAGKRKSDLLQVGNETKRPSNTTECGERRNNDTSETDSVKCDQEREGEVEGKISDSEVSSKSGVKNEVAKTENSQLEFGSDNGCKSNAVHERLGHVESDDTSSKSFHGVSCEDAKNQVFFTSEQETEVSESDKNLVVNLNKNMNANTDVTLNKSPSDVDKNNDATCDKESSSVDKILNAAGKEELCSDGGGDNSIPQSSCDAVNNSGLSALMSSYTGSDSDTDSS